jgi:hypothetical protein
LMFELYYETWCRVKKKSHSAVLPDAA